MRLLIISLICLGLLLLLYPLVALAQGAGTPRADDPAGQVNYFIQMLQAKEWWPAIGGIIMFLTWVFNKIFKDRLPKDALPWIAAGLGTAAQVVGMIIAGTVWWQALLAGLTTGLAAAGLWSAAGKKLLKKKNGDAA